MAWLSFYLYIAALGAACIFFPKHRGIAATLAFVWAFLTLTSYFVDARTQMVLALMTDIAAGILVGSRWRNGVSGVVTLFFIPMVILNTVQFVTGFMSFWPYFISFALLSWMQIAGFFAGACFNGVERFFNNWLRSGRLFDTVAARLGPAS